ncbi:type II toxin-antitoxin system VapC family toxin [Aureimonas altamirensis]|uniref:type II toxin-antitoxin system VapC family toxin n=1 Tax=Aureimonas altamirensis TaxID=370622 RepID=UPI002036FF3C|nr:type II toxin-antitoxin system VapC family toxin [Aureimonas altamirensis]MCM2504432.1 type II toxin-antitoxin system VapC family toxin [Aureimonas altamirensis]
MIVVDTSIVISIFEQEFDGPEFAGIIASEQNLLMSSVNVHESAVVLLSRRGKENADELIEFLRVSKIDVVPFDLRQARVASEAYARFGKGSGAKAQLNLADCAAYALATAYSAPLLFKGNDFTHTDLKLYR